MIRDMLMAAGAGSGPARGQVVFSTYTTGSEQQWTVPEGVTSVCILAVGSGSLPGRTNSSVPNGRAGGALAYSNDVPVTPGEVLTILLTKSGYGGYVGAATVKRGSTTLVAAANSSSGTSGSVGQVRHPGGGSGGYNSGNATISGKGGGGGAAGYAGAGGDGGEASDTEPGTFNGKAAAANSGGGGGGGGGAPNLTGTGGRGGYGGGVGLLGIGSTGYGGAKGAGTSGAAGQSGGAGSGGGYGGGLGGTNSPVTEPANGAIRIIWGAGRSYPNNAGDV